MKMLLPGKELKWLAIPIENYVREFYGKLLISAVAAERGWGAIIAYREDIKKILPVIKGVYIERSFKNGKRVNRFSGLGWHVCAWDEEGLIYHNPDEYSQQRLDEEALRKLKLAFMWGGNQRNDIIDHIKGIENKLILTGNPRFDMLRPDLRDFYSQDTSVLSRKFGRYILINTAFGSVNNYFGKEYNITKLRNAGRIATREQELDRRAMESHQGLIMRSFIDMLPVISSKFPEHKIIIRPHPSENFETWVSAAEGLSNVMMIHEGDPIPWMLGAEAVIHNSCTTGFQAYLLGRPVIAYMPVQSSKYDQYLPNAISYKAMNIDQLITLTGKFTSKPGLNDHVSDDEEKLLVTRRYVESLEGPLASDRIMDELEKLEVSPQILDSKKISEISGTKSYLVIRNILSKIKNRIKSDLKSADSNGSNSPEKKIISFRTQIFPTLSFNNIQADLKRLQVVSGRFSTVQIRLADNNRICIFYSKI
jgi:surface carbohydrate biosynthesis protein